MEFAEQWRLQVWGLAELGGAAEGLKKILEFAETVEDRVERARISNEVEQIYVLYFSPVLTKRILEGIITRQEFNPYEFTELQERLADTDRPVSTALDRVRIFSERYQYLLTPDQVHGLNMIVYGKIKIRRYLFELLAHWSNGEVDEVRTLAVKLLDEINEINDLMNKSVTDVRSVVNNAPRVNRNEIGLLWLIVLSFAALLVLAITAVLLAAPQLLANIL